MDKVIAKEVIAEKRKKTLLFTFLVVGILITAICLLRFAFSASLKKSQFTTAVVEVGDIENTITASGEMSPEFEQVLTSVMNASIQDVLLDAGTNVTKGQSIMLLDKAAAQAEYEKLRLSLESKRNSVQKLKLELEKSFYDIRSNNDIKQLKINSLQSTLEDAKRLYKAGGGTKEDIEQAELNLKVAQLEKKQLENEVRSKQKTMQVEIRELDLVAAAEEQDLNELGRKLQLANVVATRPGVITWVNKNIGASIQEGEPLVRIADLESFKVIGSISDNYISQLHNGMSAIVVINEKQFRGTVSNINPSVQNGIITFDVQLNERKDPLFRPKMKVDVYLVTDRHTNVLRVANGPAFKGSSVQDVFVLKNEKATRRTVHIGMTNFDYVELKDNVQAGEVMITSDMSDYKNVNEITINK
ncbi:efflux RND transporter periplasmic adaptor subunit [Chitinophagaceae bacterium LB-8]|uniref:Efflux RND transporter periplasmic adaptor subunit n=1 Tax=Paraflavisolibacter caeni TaxID=2982496 RepID=A0A9X3B892_9BACT|nr:HlyD family efflux transporter periplasmic adaptor subunit [Paraflavisolibacter caeni]MCU7549381.1 efflux RND transporter periplasmic adaptor subunit [Paraflavisolibacter caeni]